MKKFLKIAAIVLCLVFICGLIAINNIPISQVIDLPSENEQTEKIYLEIFTGEDESSNSCVIEDAAVINELITPLSDVKLAYRGGYSSITYNSDEDDIIVILHIDDRENRLYIKENGEVYTKTSKYTSGSQEITSVYNNAVELVLSAN